MEDHIILKTAHHSSPVKGFILGGIAGALLTAGILKTCSLMGPGESSLALLLAVPWIGVLGPARGLYASFGWKWGVGSFNELPADVFLSAVIVNFILSASVGGAVAWLIARRRTKRSKIAGNTKHNQMRHIPVLLIASFFSVATEQKCFPHDTAVHEAISESAALSSPELSTFLVDQCGAEHAPFLKMPILLSIIADDNVGSFTYSPIAWLKAGSRTEDNPLRFKNHFYDPTKSPAIGLTDGWDLFGIASFVWASAPGGGGTFAENHDTWKDARNYEAAALTEANSWDRDQSVIAAPFFDPVSHSYAAGEYFPVVTVETSAGNVFVALAGNDRVWKLRPISGSFEPYPDFGTGGHIGGTGSGDGEFVEPFDVTVSPDGTEIAVSNIRAMTVVTPRMDETL